MTDPELTWGWKRWLRLIASVFLIILSGLSIIISLGMPGVGWVISALVVIVASLMAPLIGISTVAIALAISLVHLVTFGPMAGFRLQPGVDTGFGLIAIVVPFLVGFIVLLVARPPRSS